MKLSKQDADLFFELMWPLQLFVNRQLQVLPKVSTLEAYLDCSREEKAQVRDAMYGHIELMDTFVQENPHQFSEDKLEIIAKWKHFVAGDFFIERLLKKYAIFIGSGEKVYGVLALHDAFQDMFYPGQLPVRVKAVLLPFKGRIIYDGLLEIYNIFFGRGISTELKEVYMAAKQNGRIIERLEDDIEQAKVQRPHKPAKDWGPELDELVAKARRLRGGSDQPPIYSPAFRLVKVSLELAQRAVESPDDLDRLWECLQKVERALGSVETTLHRSERYK
ncbi:MAG TPA: hypothetical protein EYP19_08385 [Desulfobacterales bacterium]|nr:hypothetical protein [Desulfobacterales bacterium]